MFILELLHSYYIFEGMPCYSEKKLGFYADKMAAESAIAFYRKLPGFCDAPNGFLVIQREISGEMENDIFYEASIYAHTEDFEDYEREVELGLFGDKDSAEKAIHTFCANNPIFMDSPLLIIERFVNPCKLNENIGWLEGFDVVPVPE